MSTNCTPTTPKDEITANKEHVYVAIRTEEDNNNVRSRSHYNFYVKSNTRERLIGDQKNKSDTEVHTLLKPKEPQGDIEKPDTEKCEEAKVGIPDGGWGWVVVLSSFVISMIADGISFSFGLLYIEFLDEFEASKSTTAWIGSLFIAVPLLSGPVMSALVDRYGCRNMTILGGIISTLGFVLASISTTLEMMMITFGVIAGLGLGLVYVTAVVSIAYWFEKKRNLAVGLGACGTGVGTFVYAPMTQYFIEEYGWRGTILLLSGTLLNLCVCGCVMRDPEWCILEQKRERQEENLKKFNENRSPNINASWLSLTNTKLADLLNSSFGKKMFRKGVPGDEIVKTEAESILWKQDYLNYVKAKELRPRSRSVEHLPTYFTYDDDGSTLVTLEGLLEEAKRRPEFEVKYPPFLRDHAKKQFRNTRQRSGSDPPLVKYLEQKAPRTYPEGKFADFYREMEKNWITRQLCVNHHCLKNLRIPLNSIGHRNAMLNIKRYKLKASSCPDIFKNSMLSIDESNQQVYNDCVICLSDMFNVTLFKRMTFNLLCLGTIMLFIWFIVPYFYLAEHMIHKGYTEDDGAGMLSLIGITNTIGMVGLGWIGDFPQVSIGGLYAVCLVLCGASVAAIPPAASTNYWLLASASAAFGLFFAASYTFTPSLLVKLVSLDDFTSAYGLVLLAQGIGHLIGPPLSGFIYDVTFSWELSFYLAGGCIVLAGLLIALILPVRGCEKRAAAAAAAEDIDLTSIV